MSRRRVLDLERDLPLDTEDRAALQRARETRIDPARIEWRSFSLALQLPNLRQSRETAHRRREVLAKSQRMHQRIAGSKLVTIPGAGHCSTIEEPEAVNAALEEFLGSL